MGDDSGPHPHYFGQRVTPEPVTECGVCAFQPQIRFREGSTVEFDDLFHRLYPPLFRYVVRLTGEVDVAEDIAQEAFVRLLRHPMPESDAKPWLYTVATNMVRDRARKATRRERILKGAPVEQAAETPDVAYERRERVAMVRTVLAELPERDRTLLMMREEGFTYAEIAKVVGVAPASVGTLLARALRRFVAAYEKQEVVDEARE